MSKRKGLSADEKRQRMLELLYEKKDVFQLKDLEKIAPKEKGIVSQSVKDVLQILVDESMIDTDKIGTSVYFWAFPSKAVHIRKCKLTNLNEQLTNASKKLKTIDEQLQKAEIGKEKSDDRETLLEKLELNEKENVKLINEIKKYQDCDPEVLEKIKKETEIARDASNRWTDNIFSTKSWCKNKFSMEEKILNKQFGIPEELDYIS